jgi:transposase
MGLAERDDGWRIPDTLWRELEPLLPAGKAHPLGCHNPRVPDRAAMNAILFVLRTGCQWNALNAGGDLLELVGAPTVLGVDGGWPVRTSMGEGPVRVRRVCRRGLELALDGWRDDQGSSGRKKNGAHPDRSRQARHEAQRADGRGGSTARPLRRWRQSCRLQMARETIENIAIARPKSSRSAPQGLCLDKGYDYGEFRELAAEFRFTAHIRCRGEEAKAIKKAAGFKARRWVVERAHS